MSTWFGCSLPDHFGNPPAEFRFARDTVALIDKNYRAHLSLSGPDRVRYLNAILTNNIKELSNGQGNVSLLLNPQGHILAELLGFALHDSVLCVSYLMIRERLIEWLDKYIIMDDVTLTDESPRYGTLALEGPRAAAIVKELCGIDLSADPELSIQEATARTIPCSLIKHSPGGVAGAEFLVNAERLPALWELLLAASRRQGGGPMGYAALSVMRLVQNIPWFGYDFGEKQIPHEAGLQDSHISYTKGCYTGQEIVERVRSRGQVNRQRVRLSFSGDSAPAPETPLLVAGKEVGFVTRSARAWDPDRILGMAYLRREAIVSNVVLEWSGGTATLL